jgi:hypothetical protein
VVAAVVALVVIGLGVTSATASGSGAADLTYISSPTPVAVPDASVNGSGVTFGVLLCPDDHKHSTGGGAALSGTDPNLDLELHSTYPLGDLQWNIDANNSSGNPAQMTMYAVCSKANFQYPRVKVDVKPGSSRVAHVACPAGTKVVGGGVLMDGGDHSVEVGSSEPSDGPDSNSKPDDAWSGTGNNGTAGTIQMRVGAVCTSHGSYKVVESARTPLPDAAAATAEALCPTGTRVTGGGVDIRGVDPSLEVQSSFPIDTGDIGFEPDNGWSGTAYNDDSGQPDHMSTFAICQQP